jgi:hypothetical protein
VTRYHVEFEYETGSEMSADAVRLLHSNSARTNLTVTPLPEPIVQRFEVEFPPEAEDHPSASDLLHALLNNWPYVSGIIVRELP